MTTDLDTNVLCYMLDLAFCEHRCVAGLVGSLSQDNTIAVNPTVIDECYRILSHSQHWVRWRQERALRASNLKA